jgi:hypothetical protein
MKRSGVKSRAKNCDDEHCPSCAAAKQWQTMGVVYRQIPNPVPVRLVRKPRGKRAKRAANARNWSKYRMV